MAIKITKIVEDDHRLGNKAMFLLPPGPFRENRYYDGNGNLYKVKEVGMQCEQCHSELAFRCFKFMPESHSSQIEIKCPECRVEFLWYVSNKEIESAFADFVKSIKSQKTKEVMP